MIGSILQIWDAERAHSHGGECALTEIVLPDIGRCGLASLLDGLENPTSDGVWITLRVRAAIFQVAFPIILGEGMRHTDGGSAVSDTP